MLEYLNRLENMESGFQSLNLNYAPSASSGPLISGSPTSPFQVCNVKLDFPRLNRSNAL